jgi:hypothetical protein
MQPKKPKPVPLSDRLKDGAAGAGSAHLPNDRERVNPAKVDAPDLIEKLEEGAAGVGSAHLPNDRERVNPAKVDAPSTAPSHRGPAKKKS